MTSSRARKHVPAPVSTEVETGEDVSPPKVITYCDNHKDVEAVHITNGVAFQSLRLCADCVPHKWR